MTRSPTLASPAHAGAANRAASTMAKAKERESGFIGLSLVACRDLEGVFRRENVSPSRERMEQEVLFVEQIIDSEIEREILRGVVVHFHVHHKKVVEGAEYMRDDIGVIERRILLPAIARRDRVGPAFIRPVGHAGLGPPVRNKGNALADDGRRQACQW